MSEKNVLTGEAILGGTWQPKIEEIDVSEWYGPGAVIYVREISAIQQDDFEAELRGEFRNARAAFLVRSICDEKGNRILGEKDAATLGQKGVRFVRKLFDAASELNGFAVESVEEMEKNSEAMLEEDSPSS